MAHPLVPHWLVVKHILCYLQGTLSYGLIFKPSIALHLWEFFYVNWASCPDDNRSISSVIVYLDVNNIPWSSKKQPLVSRSSTEVEYHVIANAVAYLIWIKALLNEL